MHPGDQVFILCTVHDADADSFTMWVSAIVYRHGKQVTEVTQADVLFQMGQR